MDKILIVSSADNSDVLYKELLSSYVHEQVIMAKDGNEAKRLHLNQTFDLIIINTPLKDEYGHDLAAMLSRQSSAGLMLLVKNDLYDQISDRVEAYGVAVVSKPIHKQQFHQALKIVVATRNRLIDLQKENLKLQHKIEDIRMVDRAKFALIKYLNFSEPQAHRYIEKHAMDMRIPKREVAENIIKTYDTWRDSN